MFYRKIYDRMKAWKEKADGRTALLIEGARRVGKSTVAKAFAENEYAHVLLIDFSTASPDVVRLFDDLSDLDTFFLQLQLFCHVSLEQRKSVIIFDEVQFCPRARQAIKHLVADRRYDYIETGSLISIRKNVKDILIPSEETRMEMTPMDFEEFCLATGKDAVPELLRTMLTKGKPIADAVHRKLIQQFRIYMLVGGMPQAVENYLETNDFRKVDDVKRTILSLYAADFEKIDGTGKASMIFRSIPAQLAKNTARYQVSSVLKNHRAEDILELVSEMQDSKTVLVSHHADDPNMGMAANLDLAQFKLFLSDTGLFVTLMFLDSDFVENDIYQKLLSDKAHVNLGYLYENITAQMLVAQGYHLYYYTFPKENTKLHYEVDFLLPERSKIIPIEVKSSGYRTHASLDAFAQKFSSRISRRLLVYPKNLQKGHDVICLPIYLLPFLREMLHGESLQQR